MIRVRDDAHKRENDFPFVDATQPSIRRFGHLRLRTRHDRRHDDRDDLRRRKLAALREPSNDDIAGAHQVAVAKPQRIADLKRLNRTVHRE